MDITIYSESPKTDIKNLANINIPVDLIIASCNLGEFLEWKNNVEKYHSNVVKGVGYWPVLNKEEGYWMSPFSKREGLERVISELENRSNNDRLTLHWDSELPTLNKRLMLTEAKYFSSNKKRITDFLKHRKGYGLDLVISEYPTYLLPEAIQRQLGIAFDPEELDSKKVKMLYSKKYLPNKVDRAMRRLKVREGVRMYKERFGFGIGCLSTHIPTNDREITTEEFARDLEIAQEEGVSSVYIYSLAGMSPEYSEILEEAVESI